MLDFSTLTLIGQLAGFAAYGVSLVSLAHKKDRSFLNYMLAAHIFWIGHFALINAFSGSLSQLVSLLRTGSARFIQNPSLRKMMLVPVLLAYAAVGFITVHQPLDILPLLGSGVAAIMLLLSSSGIRMRLGFLFSSFCWVLYSAYNGSVPGVLHEITTSSINLWTIYRICIHPGQKAGQPVEDSLS